MQLQQHTKEEHTHVNSFITCNFIFNFTKEYLPQPFTFTVQCNIHEMAAQTILQAAALSNI